MTLEDYDTNEVIIEEDLSSAVDSDEHSQQQETDQLIVGKGETKAVCVLRLLVLGILGLITVCVSVGVFRYGRNSEYETFETQFQSHALRFVNSFMKGSNRRVKALEDLCATYTTQALARNSSWPYVMLNEMERVDTTLELSDAAAVAFMPIVSDLDLEGNKWGKWTQRRQNWLYKGLLLQEDGNMTKVAELLGVPVRVLDVLIKNYRELNGDEKAVLVEYGIPSRLYNPTLTGEIEHVNGTGHYLPVWQFAPAIPHPEFVNKVFLAEVLEHMMDTKNTFVGKSFIFDEKTYDFINPNEIIGAFLSRRNTVFDGGPFSNLFLPIFDSFEEGNKNLVGVLNAFVYWQLYFEDVLPDQTRGIIVMLESTENQTYTYEVNGAEALYIGEGDFHDGCYDNLEVTTSFGTFMGEVGGETPAEERFAAYRLRIYPSRAMQDEYLTRLPSQFAWILAATFVFTSLVFLAYDFFVERRQRLVLTEAIKSGRVVNSLFPYSVRDRLYEGAASQSNDKKTFKTVLSESTDSISNTSSLTPKGSSMPIADLYQNCTVLFADIKGFTKWSSQREPVEVFRLLETIYGAFDRTAKRLKVCKIETIGDCYLAVTGLPQPQEAHAIIMARFAVLLDTKMSQIAHQLVTELGSDTYDLQMRVGLHSGPVTAGVLRGEKARFQLFGDTVNTASRMESTGEGGKIQASQATADLLVIAGRQTWLEPRKELVEAKGKGSMQTYWLRKDLFSFVDSASDRTSQSLLSHDRTGFISMLHTSPEESFLIDLSSQGTKTKSIGSTCADDNFSDDISL